MNDSDLNKFKVDDTLKEKLIERITSFGKYPYSSKTDVKSIEWNVLDIQKGKALLCSKYGIDARKYNSSLTEVTWETCTLRKWLNNKFLKTAFTPEERSLILETIVTADKNSSYSTNPGNATTDKIFLLSIPEAQKYFINNNERKTSATPYANYHGAHKVHDDFCCWWLRSPGIICKSAAHVHCSGNIDEAGYLVDIDFYVVRPALWIDLTNL